jgi:hypothetical protein
VSHSPHELGDCSCPADVDNLGVCHESRAFDPNVTPEDLVEKRRAVIYPPEGQAALDMELQVRCARMIEASVRDFAAASERASAASDRLNRTLFVVGLIGTLIGGLSLWRSWAAPAPVVNVQPAPVVFAPPVAQKIVRPPAQQKKPRQ